MNGGEDDGKEAEIVKTAQAHFLRVRHGLAQGGLVAVVGGEVEGEKDADQRQHHERPGNMQVLQRPEKRHALQVAEKERGIADGRETAGGVADDEDEKDGVIGAVSLPIHPDPRPDHQHGGSGRAHQIGQDGTGRQKEGVVDRSRRSPHRKQDPPGHDEEGADERDEAEILHHGVAQMFQLVQPECIVASRD